MHDIFRSARAESAFIYKYLFGSTNNGLLPASLFKALTHEGKYMASGLVYMPDVEKLIAKMTIACSMKKVVLKVAVYMPEKNKQLKENIISLIEFYFSSNELSAFLELYFSVLISQSSAYDNTHNDDDV
ncbi:hypothetical protein ENBRE01_3121 [Enteropsectra breve]|nr:hypothetical protein ENBRE01_3121 [Enteropsectra breve]